MTKVKHSETNREYALNPVRDAKIQISGNGKGANTFKLGLPSVWMDHIGVNKDNRDIQLVFDPETNEITIKVK